MQRLRHLGWEGLKSILIQGRDAQSFLDAIWLQWLLAWTPQTLKRQMVLWILSLSPHYFYRQRPEYRGSTQQEFLAGEEKRNRTARKQICDQLLAPYLSQEKMVLDLGCGPGFLAAAVAPWVKKVYASDLSSGVLACARIINGAPNIVYFRSDAPGYAQVPTSSLDLVYSLAVIQHLQAETIELLFLTMAEKTKPSGIALLQVQLETDSWRPEKTWVDDKSILGRFRYRYALHCFPRTGLFFQEMALKTGWKIESIQPLSKILQEPFDDVYHQHLLVMKKSA